MPSVPASCLSPGNHSPSSSESAKGRANILHTLFIEKLSDRFLTRLWRPFELGAIHSRVNIKAMTEVIIGIVDGLKRHQTRKEGDIPNAG